MSDRLVWRIHWIRTYFCLIWAVFLLIGLTYFGDTPSVSTTILGSVLTAVSGVGLFRALSPLSVWIASNRHGMRWAERITSISITSLHKSLRVQKNFLISK